MSLQNTLPVLSRRQDNNLAYIRLLPQEALVSIRIRSLTEDILVNANDSDVVAKVCSDLELIAPLLSASPWRLCTISPVRMLCSGTLQTFLFNALPANHRELDTCSFLPVDANAQLFAVNAGALPIVAVCHERFFLSVKLSRATLLLATLLSLLFA